MTTALNQVLAWRQELNDKHVERADQVDVHVMAILIGEHVVAVGGPGTGKSMLARNIAASIPGAKVFEWQLHKTSVTEEVFGPISITALKNDSYKRHTNGKLPEAHIAFIDEIFKANSAMLNTFLAAMNEKVFYNNGVPTKIPLISLIGASNELPSDKEETAAMVDRFLFKIFVPRIHEDGNFIAMLSNPDEPMTTEITFELLEQAQREVTQVEVTEHTLQTLADLRREIQYEGIHVSDRRYKKAIKALQAAAFLGGRDVIDGNDFSVLQHVLWDTPENAAKVTRIVLSRTNPLDRDALAILDDIREIRREVEDAVRAAKANGDESRLTARGSEWFVNAKKVAQRHSDLKKRAQAQNITSNKIDEAQNVVKQTIMYIASEVLGMDMSELNV